MTAEEAVRTFVHPGDMIAAGGFVVNRRPYALIREIIRQKIGNLYIEGGPSGGDIDMLIGAGLVTAINAGYISNAGFSMVCRRYCDAVVNHKILNEDYTMDVHTIIYHGAALGFPYVPIKNMLGSDIERCWGISEEERRKHPKLPPKKFVLEKDPFEPDSMLCLVPTPKIDTALIHVQYASPDGTVRIIGAEFQDTDIAIAAKHTVVSCEKLLSNEEIRKHPELNTLSGLCVDAVVPAAYGALPSQCFGFYDYDTRDYNDYAEESRTQEGFDAYIGRTVYAYRNHEEFITGKDVSWLETLTIDPEAGYVPGLNSMKKGE